MRNWLHRLDGNSILMTILVGGPLLAVFLLVNALPLWHTDIWAHVHYGSWIIEHQSLPMTEPYTPYADPKPYVPFAWLSQSVMAFLYQQGARLPFRWSFYDVAQPGGVDLLRFVHALLVVLRFGLLYLAFRRFCGSPLVSWLGMLLCIVLSWSSLEVLRPQVWGEFFFALMLFMVCRKPPSRLAAWVLPLIMVIWANMHGSYLSGLLVLLGILVSRMLLAIKASQKGSGGYAFHETALRRTFRMFYISILAIGLLNPFLSFRWYSETLAMANNANVRTMDEWAPLTWNSPIGMTFAISLLVVVITQVVSKLLRVRGISIGHGLLLICFGAQVVVLERMLPWWAMLCPLVCVGPWSRWLGASPVTVATSWPRRLVRVALVLTMLWIGFAWSTMGNFFLHEEITKLEDSLHPATPRVMARAYLPRSVPGISPAFAQAVQRPGSPVFCSETLGDYLFFCRVPVICFTHVHLFSERHWQRCLAVKRGDPQWEKILNEWNASSVCVEAELHPQLCEQIRRSPHWQIALDEAGSTTKPNPKSRLFIASRK